MNHRFTQKAQNAIQAACNFARELGHTYIGSEHLLLGLAFEQDGIASRLLEGLGVSSQKMKDTISELTGVGTPTMVGADEMTPRMKRILEASADLAGKSGQTYIGTEYLLAAILNEHDSVAVHALENCGISVSDLKNSVLSFLGSTGGTKTASHESIAKSKSTAQTGTTTKETTGAPTLSAYGKNMTQIARDGKLDPIIGRDSETERVIQILSRRTKNNPCLIGEPGVGKTAVVEGLAQRIANGTVPEILKNKVIITLDIPSMIAGAKYRGEFEERMKNVMSEAARVDGATRWQVFYKVIMPLSKPIVIYTILMGFMAPWGDYMLARFLINNNSKGMNVAVGMYKWLNSANSMSTNYTMFCAAGVCVSIPVTAVFLCLQKYYVEGVTGGAVKG